ncbi:hypothetical protein ACP275_02G183700 [Erythranthe tilingii]
MENSQQLATESFSYSWLTDRQLYSILSENSIDQKDQNFKFDVPLTEYSFTVHADEIFSDGHIMPLYIDRPSKPEALIRTTTSEVVLSPPPVSPINYYSCDSLSKTPLLSKRITECFLFEKWRKSSKRIFLRFFAFVKPVCKSRKSNRVDDLERKVWEVRSWSNSVEASPTRLSSSAFDWSIINIINNNNININSNINNINEKKIGGKSDFNYGMKNVKSSWSSSSPRVSPSRASNASCDVESSIHEAIMHCKRSIEK